ncbi:FAD-dependent oxidoreductase [Saccharopolyspora phatthalungensis]|uniref:Assimilatory nitrate reductase electron transfer subunit n=1 Tax=Saccharopolyspora phatthalungensis TaxID=664693 RepID=A0A840QDQ4_9PSEU|nr:FAD-dependent oxidoreductase [Saccharopolyspora phatthalungensis]MBB5158137.1 assimilatory nitrate reductase electron transfer subunit [Saccharopolyspora phatthalungensis]
MSRIVIVGNGPAAHRLVERLRAQDHTGPITVLGREEHPAYNRVLLGAVLDRTLTPATVTLPTVDAEVRLRVTATGIDRARRVVRTDTGDEHPYDVLVLATGSRPRMPEVTGLHGEHLQALRTLADCARIDSVVGPVAVLGGGILGVEAARALLTRGHEVTLVHPNPHLMDRQLDDAGGRLLAERLGKLGVELRLGRKTVAYRPGRLFLDNSDVVPANLVVACTGVTPETGLAARAGLPVQRGIVVDDQLRTSDPRIHAIGDCAEHDGDTPGLIASAWEQADALAALLTGADTRYCGTRTVTRLKARGIDLVSIGSVDGLNNAEAEVVTLSDPARGRYAKLALREERITGAVLVGFPEAIASVSQLHDRDLPVPTDRLALLLGTPAAVPGTPVELPDDAVICRCNNVTKKSLTTAWQGGARSVPELARATRATTGCGGCVDDVGRICGALANRLEHQKEGAA